MIVSVICHKDIFSHPDQIAKLMEVVGPIITGMYGPARDVPGLNVGVMEFDDEMDYEGDTTAPCVYTLLHIPDLPEFGVRMLLASGTPQDIPVELLAAIPQAHQETLTETYGREIPTLEYIATLNRADETLTAVMSIAYADEADLTNEQMLEALSDWRKPITPTTLH